MTDRAEVARVEARRRTDAPAGARPRRAPEPGLPVRALAPVAPASNTLALHLQRSAGNLATGRLLSGPHKKPHVQREPPSPAPAAGATAPSPPVPNAAPSGTNRVAFVREEGLNLREVPDQTSKSLAQLRFGTRVRVLEEEALHPGWQKVTTPAAAVGFLHAPRVHFPPSDLISRDPGMTMVRIRSGQTFWGLVKEQYGIRGDESTADQNINHFINAIRAVNKGDAFIVETDWLDDIGNWLFSGRDASDTLLKAGYDLWIPSFGVAAAMDVGSGTLTGEAARIVKKIEQKIADFKGACAAAVKYAPEAITKQAGDTAMGLLHGLIDFAIDAAKILAISTAAGALIGALFGGVGAVPGAEIGFEIGLLILEYYGLAIMIEAILGIAGNLLSELGSFVSQVWNADGDPKKVDLAGKTLANALGTLVSALLIALAAYLIKKGGDSIAKSKFGRKVGESEIARWLADRQKMKTTKETSKGKKEAPSGQQGGTQQSLKERLDELAKDHLDHGGKETPGTRAEAEAAIGVEKAEGLGPFRRPKKGEGHAGDFVDETTGIDWDVKRPRSRDVLQEEIRARAREQGRPEPKLDPNRTMKGEFDLKDQLADIRTELATGERVIVDTRSLNPADAATLRTVVADPANGIPPGTVVLWP